MNKTPFLDLVRDARLSIRMKTVRALSTVVTRTNDSDRSIEMLEKELEELRTVQEKVLYLCKNGNDEEASELMNRILSENTVDISKIVDKQSSDCSLLHLCASRNKVHCMEQLVTRMSVECTDTLQATPLHYAVVTNNQESVAFLLSQNANVNAKDSYNRFPLLIALKNKFYKIAEMLVSVSSCDINLRGSKGNTVLHTLCEEGDAEGVRFLFEKCGTIPQRRNYDEQNVLQYAVKFPEIASYISEKIGFGLGKMIINTDCYGNNIMHDACTHGYFDGLVAILKNLDREEIKAQAITTFLNQPNKLGDTPLILAVKSVRSDMVNLLCQAMEVHVNDGDRLGQTPLYHAISKKDKQIISTLQAAGGTLKADAITEDIKEETNTCISCLKSLNTLLVIMLSLVAIVCIFCIAAISFSFFGANISESGNKLREKYFSEVMTFLGSNIEEHTLIARTIVATFKGKYNVSSEQDVQDFVWNAYTTSYKQMGLASTIYCGLPTGEQAGIQKAAGLTGLEVFSSYSNPTIITFTPVTDIPTKTLNVSASYTTRADLSEVDPWLELAKQQNGSGWTSSYATPAFPGFLWNSFVISIRDKITNRLDGYCAMDAPTESINEFLQESSRSVESTIIIVERKTGYLIATSDNSVVPYTQNGNDVVRYDGTNSDNSLINTVMKYGHKNYGGRTFQKVRSNIFDEVSFGSSRYALHIGNLNDGLGVDWIVIHSMPMSIFFKGFYIGFIVMACTTAFLLLTGVVASFICAKLFMRPLTHIIRQAEHIKMLQLEQVEKSLEQNMSHFSEVRTIQFAFRSMTRRLKQFRTFIPDHILAVIEADLGGSTAASPKKVTTDDSYSLSDSISETRGTSVSQSAIHGNALVSNALKSSLTSGTVSIMIVKFSDFNHLFEEYSATEIADSTKDLFTVLKKCLRKTRGQLVYTNSESAMVAWNTFITQSDHVTRACQTAISCVDHVRKLQTQWKKNRLPPLNVSITVTSGMSYFGNIGSDGNKMFTVMGKTAVKATKISSLQSELNIPILCSDEVYEAAKEEIEMRPVGKLQEGENYAACVVYEIGKSKTGDEWMEELQKKHPWDIFTEAFNFFENKQYFEANDMFNQYLTLGNPSDKLAQKFVELCGKHLESKDQEVNSII